MDSHFGRTLSAGTASTNFCQLIPPKMDFRLVLFPQESSPYISTIQFLFTKLIPNFQTNIFMKMLQKKIK